VPLTRDVGTTGPLRTSLVVGEAGSLGVKVALLGEAGRPPITPRIARRGIESSGRLGCHRYVVERSLAWLVGCRRLQVRYERHADILLGFASLACALICLNLLNRPKGGRQRLLA
jgi:hypothetical protein